MDSFDELSLSPELVEALAAEGIERPTALQSAAIPVLHRGNDLVAVAGPGSGLLVAMVAPLLDRVEAVEGSPQILLLTSSGERASALALALGRVAAAAGHRAAATEGPWAFPGRASLLVATPADAEIMMTGGVLSLEGVQALVVDDGAALQISGELPRVETILGGVPSEAQRVLVALPITPELEKLADGHLRRAMHIPSRADQDEGSRGPDRGTLAVRELTGGSRDDQVAALCAELLAESDHVTLFVRNEDSAADLGDSLSLRGFQGGPPGDDDVPVWLAADDLTGRTAMDGASREVVAVSVDVPADPDALDRRHGGGRGGVVLVEPRELPHLRDVARRAGYRLRVDRAAGAAPPRSGELATILRRLREALVDDAVDVDAYTLVLDPLVQEFGGSRVAAAALGFLRAKGIPSAPASASQGDSVTSSASRGALPAMVKLFVSIGEKDGVGPGDLVGAITGESGIKGGQVGRIDLRETFSIVEVDAQVAEKVMKALNGTTVRGRSVRVDLDRGERERQTGRKPGGGPRPRRGPRG